MTVRRSLRVIGMLIILMFMVAVCGACVDMGNRNPLVTMELDPESRSGITGTIKIELFPDKAPNSVNYVLALIDEGYYNDFNVSKVYNGTSVVFGDPWYAKKNDRVIDGEFAENGFDGNDVEFKRGIVGLALDSEDYNSNYGDFFIVLSDEGADQLNGKYCAIGQVTEGIEVADEIGTSKTSSAYDYQPFYGTRIKTTTVDLRGRTYDEPVTNVRTDKPGYWD